ncbi:MAG TPA: UDP-N-acetylmuramoyl-tripeptide--D-alanyl-D-alanine ligase [Candidatus Eisenbacteria bacterium]|nr:UDP-N-acetylmuramoyl-tripeptide--D-alanyl-D-alanine ligase [Candidatus Eisenbacteria bacterium]
MIPMTVAEIAAAVGGRPVGFPDPDAVVVDGPVVIDSRAADAGTLFVAVAGERADGHAFADEARARGAVVLSHQDTAGPEVMVGDETVPALGRLARAYLDRLDHPVVVGLTGSSGKTSTKDLVAHLLEALGPTVAPKESFNTEIGVPLTVLSADKDTRHLVIEMGARGAGHIAYLCEVAPPRIGVVLNIGAAHAGEFGGREATAAAKSELVQAVPPAADGGVAVLNADDPLVRAMAEVTRGRVVRFGRAADADVRAVDVTLDEQGRPGFRLVTAHGSAPVQLRLYGEHHVSNALAAAAVAGELGMPVETVAALLSDAQPRSRWRMEVSERPDGVMVVNDAYNANPDSVRAALEALVAMARGRRSWAVLGEMLELGESSRQEHEAIGRLVAQLDVGHLVVVGEGARPIQQGVDADGEESVFVPDADAALALLRQRVRPGDVVLVKASRRAGLERVAAGLLAEGGA